MQMPNSFLPPAPLAAFLCVLSLCASAQTSTAPSAGLSAAQSLIQQGHLDEAKSQVQAWLERHPASVDGYNLLGIVETEQQDFPGALAAFQKALQIAPGSTATHNNLGNLRLAEKQFDLAEKQFRATLLLDPGNRDANYNLGVLLMARGHAAEAIPRFERVRPADLETSLNLIRAYLRTKQTVQALHLAEQLSAGNNSDVRLHFSLGVMLAAEGQYKSAQLELEKADALAPNTFEILFNLGQTCLLAGNLSQAEAQLNRALTLHPDSPETLYLLAQAYSKDARPLDALALLVRAHHAAPQNTDIILLLAQTSMAQGYYEDAIPLLENGLQLAPQRSDLRVALGESYLRSDRVQQAIDQFQRVIAVQPSVRAYSFLGLAHTAIGRFDQATQDFQSGLRLDPRNAFCLENLGSIAAHQGRSAAAESFFRQALAIDPNFSQALLELASLRIDSNRLPEAEALLRKYIQVSPNPSVGYYKLAMVERTLRQTAAADRDLALFQSSSGKARPASYRYEGLYDYLNTRSQLSPSARAQDDISDLLAQSTRHPDEPEIFYLLAQAYLESGNVDEARNTIARLDAIPSIDDRTLTGAGVLLARYRLYGDAAHQFQAALQSNPASDDTHFDLANAWFHLGRYSDALNSAQQVSEDGRNDPAWLALIAGIQSHLGNAAEAERLYRAAITRSPDNDQDYLSLALVELHENDLAAAHRTLLQGQQRIPASGRILWGLGLVSVMDGDSTAAEKHFERAVDLLPEWPGSYSLLGVFYFETGQAGRAREVLDRFRNSSAAGGLDVARIEQVLAASPAAAATTDTSLSPKQRRQLLQFASALVDRTL